MGAGKDGISSQGSTFDPFNDRNARDIRNRLSEAFVFSLHQRKPEIVEKAGRDLMASVSDCVFRKYVSNRLAKYQRVVVLLKSCSSDHMNCATICLWNSDLFFECHEYLEYYWLKAVGDKRVAIQALIKSAGAFVHRSLGREVPARRLSEKALLLVESSRKRLSFIENLEDLVVALKNHGAAAPKLKGKGLSWK